MTKILKKDMYIKLLELYERDRLNVHKKLLLELNKVVEI